MILKKGECIVPNIDYFKESHIDKESLNLINELFSLEINISEIKEPFYNDIYFSYNGLFLYISILF